jgi:ribose transport system substrate-binding protein
MANRHNIPVITVDRKASAGKILCHIESDNTAGGRMAANLLVKYLKGEGRVIEIEGIPETSAAHERGMGFNEVLGEYPAIKVVSREVANFDRQEARQVMHHLLQKDIEIDGVFAHNDSMILGVIEAFEEMEIPMPRVLIGFDAIREALQAVKRGRLTATIAQQPETMGWLAIEIVVGYFRGEALPDTIAVELALITK